MITIDRRQNTRQHAGTDVQQYLLLESCIQPGIIFARIFSSQLVSYPLYPIMYVWHKKVYYPLLIGVEFVRIDDGIDRSSGA